MREGETVNWGGFGFGGRRKEKEEDEAAIEAVAVKCKVVRLWDLFEF